MPTPVVIYRLRWPDYCHTSEVYRSLFKCVPSFTVTTQSICQNVNIYAISKRHKLTKKSIQIKQDNIT